MITYPAGPITPHGAAQMLSGRYPSWFYDSPNKTIRFHIMGGQAPSPGVQTGMVCKSFKFPDPDFDLLDSQGAHQDGVTNNDTVYQPGEFDFVLKTSASRQAGISAARGVLDDWLDSWDPKQQGRLTRYTPETGHWWCDVRKAKPISDDMTVRSRFQQLTFTARNDITFMQSSPSVSVFPPPGHPLTTGAGQGFQTLTNRGDQPAWSSHLFYGPGFVAIADGPGSTNFIRFGPLEAGQIALITTLPRLRSIVDLSPQAVVASTQNLNLFQVIVKDLIDFASAGNVPPLLQQFESFFGIVPPQGVLYSLLYGRFNNPIPPKIEGLPPAESHIAVQIAAGNSQSKLISSVTPFRRMSVR